jgi:hypothetical protein
MSAAKLYRRRHTTQARLDKVHRALKNWDRWTEAQKIPATV